MSIFAKRAVSSVGSERMLHTHEVIGSNPIQPTTPPHPDNVGIFCFPEEPAELAQQGTDEKQKSRRRRSPEGWGGEDKHNRITEGFPSVSQHTFPIPASAGFLYLSAFFIFLSGFFTMSYYPERWVSG